MATYSTSLQIKLITDGTESGTWGSSTNTNWNLMEQAVAGVQSITMINADYTLSVVNGASDEARNAVLVVGGTNSAIRKIVIPAVTKTYLVINNTVGGYAITIGTSGGAVATIPTGAGTIVYCDGTNTYGGITGVAGNLSVSGNEIISGNATVGGNLAVSGNATVTGTTTFVGIPTGPTASPGTNTTQLATTAFVAAATGTLGTMATQNANAVAITGGTITGITDLAIADGGTGASTAADARTNLGLGSLATLSAVGTSQITDANVTAAKLSGAQSGSAPIFGARAWVRFDGTGSTGTNQTIIGSGNVTSVYKTATGSYTVTMTTALPNANYCAVGTATLSTSTVSAASIATSGMTTTTFNVYTHRTDIDTPYLTDSGLVNIVVMG